MYASISWETKNRHKITSRGTTLSTHIYIYLEWSLTYITIASSEKVFFYHSAGTLPWTTGSPVKLISGVTLSEMPVVDNSCLIYCFPFFSMVATFDTASSIFW